MRNSGNKRCRGSSLKTRGTITVGKFPGAGSNLPSNPVGSVQKSSSQRLHDIFFFFLKRSPIHLSWIQENP